MRRIRYAALCCAALLAACDSGGGEGSPCEDDSECLNGFYCTHGECARRPDRGTADARPDDAVDATKADDVGPDTAQRDEGADDAAVDDAEPMDRSLADASSDALSASLAPDASDAVPPADGPSAHDGPPGLDAHDAQPPDVALDDVAVPDAAPPDVALPEDAAPDVEQVVQPDAGPPDAEVNPGTLCPPRVDWRRDEMVWVASAGRIVGLRTSSLYRGGPIDLEADRAAELDGPLPRAAIAPAHIHPDGLRVLAFAEGASLHLGHLATGDWEAPPGAGVAGPGLGAFFVEPSADGTQVAIGLDAFLEGREDAVVMLDLESGRRRDFQPEQPGVQDLTVEDLRGLALSPEGHLYYTAGGQVFAADPEPRPLFEDEHGIPARPLAVGPDTLFTGVGGQLVRLDLATDPPQAARGGALDDPPLVHLYADPRGRRVFVVRRIRGDAVVEAHDPDQEEPVWRTFSAPVPAGSAAQRLALTADGAFLFHQVLGDRFIRVLDPDTGELLHAIDYGERISELVLRGPGEDAERCTGEDDDCDGFADEGFEVGSRCDGVGACGPGLVECADRERTRCTTDPGGREAEPVDEVCNGEDDDCDGVTDEDPPFIASEPVALTDSPSAKAEPGVVWTGAGYAVVWTDRRDEDPDVMMLRFDPNGRPLGDPVAIAADPRVGETRPVIAWTGESYGVAVTSLVQNLSSVTLHPVDIAGAVAEGVGFERESNAWTGGLLWTAGRFALTAFTSDPMGARTVDTAFLTREGEVLDTRTIPARSPSDMTVVDTGGTVGAVYVHGPDAEGPSGIELARFPLVGRPTHRPVARPAPPARLELIRPGVAFSPVANEYGVFYWVAANRVHDLRVARFGVDFVLADERVATTDHPASPPSAVWAATEYGVAWIDARDDRASVFFQRLDARAQAVGDPIAAVPAAVAPRSPALVWTGETYGLVYVERDGPVDQLYFVSGPLGCALLR